MDQQAPHAEVLFNGPTAPAGPLACWLGPGFGVVLAAGTGGRAVL